MIYKLVKVVFSITCLWFQYGDASSDKEVKELPKLTCYSGYEDGNGSFNSSVECPSTSGCIIFASEDAKTPTSFVSVNYFCDAKNICQSRNGLDKNVKLGSTFGDLFCCHGDRCNTRDKMPSKITADHTCFEGTAIMNGTKAINVTGALSICKSHMCLSERQFHGEIDPNFVVYTCDMQDSCGNITNTCINITQTTGTITEKCCCSTPACNKPASILPPNGIPAPTMATMPDHLLPTQKPSMIYIIGGVAAAALFSILMLIVVIVIVRWFQRRQQEHFSYIYSQLTADLSEDLDDKEDDDARMLVP